MIHTKNIDEITLIWISSLSNKRKRRRKKKATEISPMSSPDKEENLITSAVPENKVEADEKNTEAVKLWKFKVHVCHGCDNSWRCWRLCHGCSKLDKAECDFWGFVLY